MAGLTEAERACLARYLELLRARLGGRLVAVRLFGSAARGDMWPASSPMHSDIDLLVVTREELAAPEREELVNETYALYLECGRQISPHFLEERRLREPAGASQGAFLAAVAAEGRTLWPS
jgi:predicted nucleotidyltransferase